MENTGKESIITRSFYLSAAECNAQQEMSLPLLSQKLIDVATEHANILDIGNPSMPSPDMGWVLSRLTIEMSRYPKENTDYSITTWVEDWNRHFSRRAFSISDADGNTLGYARSIWMVLNTSDRSNAGLSGLNFKPEWISDRKCPIPMQEKHVRIEPDGSEPIYRFKYCDIDFYRHVNTVRYIDLLLNQFDMKTYDENIVNRLELSFLHEASYGMEIRIMKQTSVDNSLLHRLYLEKADVSQPILYSRIRFSLRDN
ncbi:MAG: acyl-[acyl-carrier-protein] thioesterase [Muribaculaceae bacterium]|nr:acyl-[acyl-carrier-protein] thioesterase [Muribaculaceae bacterium]